MRPSPWRKSRSDKAPWLLGACLGLATSGALGSSLTATDWVLVDIDADVASGTLGPVGVTLSGGDIVHGVTDGSFTGFDFPFFTPPLAASDKVDVIAPQASIHLYEISFSRAVTNPRLHIASLASTLTFDTSVVRVSGQDSFVVTAGNQVVGELLDGPVPNDANGTIELPGTFTGLTFTAEPLGPFSDGLSVQILADVVFGNGFEAEARAP